MKTNFYLLLIFLLAFSFGNAQSDDSKVSVETVKVISNETPNQINESELLIDATELKANIAKINSDIRIYLNRQRKAGNISFVFPKINKAVKA
ncbi:hypothetical protein KFZ70_11115 [Tamlana fucoidanivorans]|uniref:TonB-dependent receptor n=1 Tax=Allotamlana fucoidanivorans TaxID=2583814 RepID=A0A5C4SHS9_9FLAO|nr:hypothetical protein [Tamlana fucoidanivorans]TNJ43171.1 hypothetical protein FGF67_12520 [Tamlana fucoidanivorans]